MKAWWKPRSTVGRGSAPIDLTKTAEIYAIIEALELRALELGFEHLGHDDLERLTQANRAMQQAAQRQNAAAAVSADEEFHEVLRRGPTTVNSPRFWAGSGGTCGARNWLISIPPCGPKSRSANTRLLSWRCASTT